MSNYTIKCFSKGGEYVTFQELDGEICVLWKVSQDEEKWATPPSYQYSRNWHDFLFNLIYSSMPESGIVTIDYLLMFHLKNRGWPAYDFIDFMKKDIYYLSLLLYLKSLGYYFTIQYSL